MRIKSVFNNGGEIPLEFSCKGENKVPPIKIEEVPEGTVSLTLVMEEADPNQFIHWILFNIPPTTRVISHSHNFPGIQGKNGKGFNNYFGPCPPSKSDKYYFYLYALSTNLRLGEGALITEVDEAMKGNVIEQAELMGTFPNE